MMNLLTGWVRDLVILVIFASLVEMLLPNGALKKYVKVVMGFFIVTIVISPLLLALRGDQQIFYPFLPAANPKLQQQIQRQGEQMQKENEKLVRGNLQTQLAQQMRALILTQEGVEDAEVKVIVSKEGKIDSVQINLTPVKDQQSSPTSEISNVTNVKIVIGSTNQMEQPVTADLQQSEKIRGKVIKLLEIWYNIKPEAIRFE